MKPIEWCGHRHADKLPFPDGSFDVVLCCQRCKWSDRNQLEVANPGLPVRSRPLIPEITSSPLRIAKVPDACEQTP